MIRPLLSKVFERLVSVRFGRFMESSSVLPTTHFPFRKVLDTCDALLCASHTLQSELESGQGARIVQVYFWMLLIGSPIRNLSIISVLWLLEILCCLLYWQSFYRIDRSSLWWTVVWVNWSINVCQECRCAVFWARYCSFCTNRSCFPYWRIRLTVCLWLHLDGCC